MLRVVKKCLEVMMKPEHFLFYRAWIFRKVPKAKATEMFAVLSSCRRVINMVTPVIAGVLATISAMLLT